MRSLVISFICSLIPCSFIYFHSFIESFTGSFIRPISSTLNSFIRNSIVCSLVYAFCLLTNSFYIHSFSDLPRSFASDRFFRSFIHLFKRWFVLKTCLFTLQIMGEEIKSEERPFWFAPRGLNLTVKAEEKPKEDPFASFKKMNPKDRLRQYLRKRMKNFSTNQNVFARVMSDVDSGRK